MKQTVSLKKNYEFRRLYNKGESAATSRMIVYCRPNRGNVNRLGLTVGKKLGKAVVRNRVRRRIREIYRLAEPSLKTGCDVVIVARSRAVDAPYARLEDDFRFLAKKLGLLADATP